MTCRYGSIFKAASVLNKPGPAPAPVLCDMRDCQPLSFELGAGLSVSLAVVVAVASASYLRSQVSCLMVDKCS